MVFHEWRTLKGTVSSSHTSMKEKREKNALPTIVAIALLFVVTASLCMYVLFAHSRI